MTTRDEVIERMDNIQSHCLGLSTSDWDDTTKMQRGVGQLLGMIAVLADAVKSLTIATTPLRAAEQPPAFVMPRTNEMADDE